MKKLKEFMLMVGWAILIVLFLIWHFDKAPDIEMYHQEEIEVEVEVEVEQNILDIPEYYAFNSAFITALKQLGEGEDKLFRWRGKVYKVVLK